MKYIKNTTSNENDFISNNYTSRDISPEELKERYPDLFRYWYESEKYVDSFEYLYKKRKQKSKDKSKKT